MNGYYMTVNIWINERMRDMGYYLRPFRPSARDVNRVTTWAHNILVSMNKPEPKTQQFESVINGLVNAYYAGVDFRKEV